MTKVRQPKKWPHYAKWARDDCGDLLQSILRDARDLQAHPDTVVAARAGHIADKAQRAIRYLNQVGASIREDGL